MSAPASFLCFAAAWFSPGGGRRASRRGQRAEAGFTVIEAGVAGALVTVFLAGLFALNSNMMHLLRASSEAANASQDLQQRVEQVRLANWSQLTDPAQFTGSDATRYNFAVRTYAYANLPGVTETLVVGPYAPPPAALDSGSPPPYVATRDGSGSPPVVFTAAVNPDGSVALNPDGSVKTGAAGYAFVNKLAQQGMLRVDLTVTWPSISRTRTRTLTTVVSRWGVSK